MNRSVKRAGVVVGGTVLVGALFLSGRAESQIPPPPTLPPGFTLPTFPPPPTMPPFTFPPPPTMPPSTTTPPPTMPPSTTTPPPTMPPSTVPSQADSAIQDIINRLRNTASQFGFDVQDIIDQLIALQNSN